MRGSKAGVSALTVREGEVLELVGRGLSDKAIAARLGLSRKTVETYLQRAFGKLGVHSRTAAAVAWLQAVQRDSAVSQDAPVEVGPKRRFGLGSPDTSVGHASRPESEPVAAEAEHRERDRGNRPSASHKVGG